jgi:TonB-dependent starch-binding outer membrane protein SusC
MKKIRCGIIPDEIHFRISKVLLTMKLTILALLIGVFQGFALSSYSQVTKLNLKMQNNTIKEVLAQVEEQSEFYFLYNSKLVDVERKVDVSGKDMNITEVLNQMFAQSGVTYNIVDRQIVLSSRDMPAASPAVQQQGTISGRVTDRSGSPLPGVTVVIRGTTSGTVSNADGAYTVTNVTPAATLVFSFVGMRTVEIAVGNQTVINVTMAEETIGIEEVVAVGYGTQKKVNLTGSIATVRADDLGNIPAANLSNTIAGRAPGVTVVSPTGLAGASSDIRIRGSFAEPLYVINGVIKNKADFDALDATEVESINFLKDAASAAIYGSKAGNGVVLVTTKVGTIQKPVFDYKGSISTSRTTRPVQDYTATDEIEYLNQVAVTWGRAKPHGQHIYDYFKDKSYSINDYIWQNPSVQQHNIGVRGGSEALVYYMSLGYHSEDGSYHNLKYDRYNFRSDVTANITKRFKVNMNVSGNQRNYHRWYWPYDGAENFNVPDFFRATFNWTRLYPFYVDEQGNPTSNTNAIPVVPGAWHPVELVRRTAEAIETLSTVLWMAFCVSILT